MFNSVDYKKLWEDLVPFHKVLGLKVVEIGNGRATILIPFKPELVGDPRINRIHGGVISTAMDAAGGAAGITTLGSDNDLISTIDIRIDYLYPGRAEDILVEGKIIKDGKSVIFTNMYAHHAQSNELIAEGRAVYRVRRYGEQ